MRSKSAPQPYLHHAQRDKTPSTVAGENTVWYLRRNRLFERVGDEVIHDSWSLFTVVQYGDGTELFSQGSPAGTVYFLKRGHVRLARVTESGKALTIGVLGPGDVFGEEGIFSNGDRNTTATVVEGALVCTAGALELLALMRRQPVLALNMARYLQEQRNEAISTLEDVSYLTVPERVFKLLERLAIEDGVKEADGVRIALRLTHTDIAAMIGSTRETVSLQLGKLIKSRRVLMRGREYLLPFPPKRAP